MSLRSSKSESKRGWMRRSASGLLVATILISAGCATTGLGGQRTAKLPLAPCPPDTVTMEIGWLGPGFIATSEGPIHVFAMTVAEKTRYEAWIDAWKTCAQERGDAIEAANK